MSDKTPSPAEHATVPFHGHVVPLIGVPASASEEACDYCGHRHPIADIQLHNDRMLCPTCRKVVSPTFPAPPPARAITPENETWVRMARSRIRRGRCPECAGSADGWLPDPNCKICNGKVISSAEFTMILKSLNERFPE